MAGLPQGVCAHLGEGAPAVLAIRLRGSKVAVERCAGIQLAHRLGRRAADDPEIQQASNGAGLRIFLLNARGWAAIWSNMLTVRSGARKGARHAGVTRGWLIARPPVRLCLQPRRPGPKDWGRPAGS